MKTYVFVGSYCELDNGRVKLDRFGQRIELVDSEAENVIRGGGAILPEADFSAIGFDQDELKKYALPGPRANAPAEFHEKVRSAVVAYCELRAHTNGGV